VRRVAATGGCSWSGSRSFTGASHGCGLAQSHEFLVGASGLDGSSLSRFSVKRF
jgi:hypothetical protein